MADGLSGQRAAIREDAIGLGQGQRRDMEIVLQKVHAGREVQAEGGGNTLNAFLSHLLEQVERRREIVVCQGRAQAHGAVIDLAERRGIDGDVPTERGRVEAARETGQVDEWGDGRAGGVGGQGVALHTFLQIAHRRQDLPGLRVEQDDTGGGFRQTLAGLESRQQVGGCAGRAIRGEHFGSRACQPVELSPGNADGLQLQVVIQGGGNGQAAAFHTARAESCIKLGKGQVDKSRGNVALTLPCSFPCHPRWGRGTG